MSDAADRLFDLADACQAEADKLQDIARSLNFEEPHNSRLNQNEMALRAKATLLRGAAVDAALDGSQEAQNKLKDATSAAQKATARIGKVEDGIKVAGLLLSLAASAITGDVPAILASGDALINGVAPLVSQVS